jgi:hypothetical protein
MTNGCWTYKRLTRLPWYLVGVVLGVRVVVFALATSVAGFQHAWNVLSGIESPFHHKGRGLTVPLSFLGYVFVPLVVSVAATTALASFVRRRLLSDAEANSQMRTVVQPALNKFLEEVAPKEQEK